METVIKPGFTMSSPSPEFSGSDSKSDTVCFLCRQRKTKCDRNLPRCGFCIKAKVECQYTARPKKRGLRAGYVSELEARLENLENEVRASKRTRPTINPPDFIPVPISSAGSTPLTNAPGFLPPNSASTRALQRDGAVEDLKSLPLPLIYNLVELWFKDMQPWCPIIRRPVIQASLEALPNPVDRVDDVVLRAVLALMISFSSQAIILGYKGRGRLSQHLRSEVLAEAVGGKVSLASLQALLIIAILDYGSDNVQSTWSLLSVCRRMCEQTGLFKQVLAQIEHQSPVNVGPPSRADFESDELAVPLTWVTLALDSASTLGAPWRDTSASLMEHLASVAYLSTPDFSDSFRTTTHLASIGLQPVQMLFYEQSENTLTACDEIYENLLTYRRSQTLPTYTLLPDGSINFDPNAVLTSMLTNAAIIVLYQRPISLTDPAHAVAKQRCLEACEEMITTIRTVSDADTELNSPLLAPRIFLVARFMLALFRATGQPRKPSFDVLMHGINMCGRRWTLARRLDICLRAAIVEVDALADGHPVTGITLPSDFWDLRKSAVDINDDLIVFVESCRPSLYVGSLNGPYE